MNVSEAITRKQKIDPVIAQAGWNVSDDRQVKLEVDTKKSDFLKRDYKTFEHTFLVSILPDS